MKLRDLCSASTDVRIDVKEIGIEIRAHTDTLKHFLLSLAIHAPPHVFNQEGSDEMEAILEGALLWLDRLKGVGLGIHALHGFCAR